MKRRLRPALIVLGLVVVVAGSRWLGLDRFLSVEGMRALVEPWGEVGPLVFIAVCVAGVVLHLPEALLIALGAVVFGAPRGFAYGWVASVAGATLTFLIARYLVRDWVQRTLGGRFDRFRRLDARLAVDGFRVVLVLRLLLFLAPPLNWAIGTTSVSLRSYVAGTAIGVVPGLVGTVYVAETLAAADSFRDLLTAEFLVPTALIAGLVFGAWIASRRLLASAESVPG